MLSDLLNVVFTNCAENQTFQNHGPSSAATHLNTTELHFLFRCVEAEEGPQVLNIWLSEQMLNYI